MRAIYLIVIVVVSCLLVQTAAFAATEFYVTSLDTHQRIYCDSLEIKKSTVTCDTSSLAITYDVTAIASITVVNKGTEYNFQNLNQDAIRQINAFNSENIAQKIRQEQRKEVWTSLGISEPTLIKQLASVSNFSDAVKLLKDQYTENGFVGLLPILIPLLGILVFFIGVLWYLVSAFQVSTLWGFGCFFLPFIIPLIFLVTKWKAASKPFILMILGIVFTLSGVFFFGVKKRGDSSPINTTTNASSFKKPESSKYTCKGKTLCSQMTSCEEATFYQHNCPGTKMDGDGDGIPCERQWCK